MREVDFVPGEYYHVFSRTLLHIPIFNDSKNSERLKRSFWMANSDNSRAAFQFLRNHKDASLEELLELVVDGKKLVDVLCYSIMPDHYHLLLRERLEGGISEFIRKCNISISKYNNIKNERKGPIFEGRFSAKHVDSNRYLLHLFCYIQLNPLDFLVDRSWREHGLKDWRNAKRKLLDYPWSSVASFLNGETEEDVIISGTNIILDQFSGVKEHERFLKDWSGDNLNEIRAYI